MKCGMLKAESHIFTIASRFSAQFAGNAHWAEPSPVFAHRARPTPLKCKNEYLVLALGEETAAQVVVVWAFRRLKKPRCQGSEPNTKLLRISNC